MWVKTEDGGWVNTDAMAAVTKPDEEGGPAWVAWIGEGDDHASQYKAEDATRIINAIHAEAIWVAGQIVQATDRMAEEESSG